MYNCKYCGKECKNDNSLRNHERLCKSNPNRQLTNYERGINTFKNRGCTSHSTLTGSDVETDTYTRQCHYCGRWYKPSSLGGHITWCNKVPSKEDKLVYISDGTLLNITNKQLEAYQQEHVVCEICGKTVEETIHYTGKYATKRLCIDHNHQTGEFRGLLCQSCNRQLGWYEKYRDYIDNYLSKK